MQNAIGSDRGPRGARWVRAVLLGLAIGLGIDLGMVIGGGLALRSWQQLAEEAARQSQQTQLAGPTSPTSPTSGVASTAGGSAPAHSGRDRQNGCRGWGGAEHG